MKYLVVEDPVTKIQSLNQLKFIGDILIAIEILRKTPVKTAHFSTDSYGPGMAKL